MPLRRYGWATLALGAAMLTAGPAAADELAEAFAAADVNGDGYLDVDEYVAAVVVRFAEHDENGDGSLSPEELPEADPAEFEEADRDDDGVLSLGETVGDRMMRFFDAGGQETPFGLISLDDIRAYDAERS